MVEGQKVTMGGKDWVVPPLNFKSLKMYRDDLSVLNPAEISGSGKVPEIILAAMNRNYPDLTLDELEEMLDLGNVVKITMAVVGMSELVETSGETPAASP